MRGGSARLPAREYGRDGERLALVAVLAHPNDEAFGPGGTLARYVAEGINVTLVTAVREPTGVHVAASEPAGAASTILSSEAEAREVVCSCRASGVRRMCLGETKSGGVMISIDHSLERLVRVLRELRPQVVVTYSPNGWLGDEAQARVSALTTQAFEAAGDPEQMPHHLKEGLAPFAPQKLYYAVLSSALLQEWGLDGALGVPEEQVTTEIDVSDYAESKLKALYCSRNRVTDYVRWLAEEKHAKWNKEYFTLARSTVRSRARREHDLFANLR